MGFGASGAFGEQNLRLHNDFEEIVEVAFDDLGLDIYRIQNRYNHLNTNPPWQQGWLGSKDILAEAESVTGRDIKVLMTAWGPPANLKSNNSITNGGTLAMSGGDLIDMMIMLNGGLMVLIITTTTESKLIMLVSKMSHSI